MKPKQIKNLFLLYLVLILSIFFSSNIYATEIGINQNNSIYPVKNGETFEFESTVDVKPVIKAKSQAVENLPAQYDLRNVNGKSYINPPENQNPWGCCWAFGALSAAESNALLNGALQANFSKRALSYYNFQKQNGQGESVSSREGCYITSNSPDNSKLGFNFGAGVDAVISQVTTWNGASSSEEIPYQNDQGIIEQEKDDVIVYSPNGTWSLPYEDIYDNYYHIQNAEHIQTFRDYEIEAIEAYTQEAKNLILREGALMLGFNYPDNNDYFNNKTYSQYTPVPLNPNHAVSIIGWDDNYAVSNFNPKNLPPKPGAWICKNNWATNWGNEGYFYVSYYDQSITDFCSFSAETKEMGFSYDNNEEYDYLANKDKLSQAAENNLLGTLLTDDANADQIKFANIFTAQNQQVLKAVSAYTYYPDATVNIEVYLLDEDDQTPGDGVLVLEQTEAINEKSFTTIELDQPIELPANQKYAVVENIVYEALEVNGELYDDAPGIQLEFGTNAPVRMNFYNINHNGTVQGYLEYSVDQTPGRSFVYGLNSGQPAWYDVTNPVIQDRLSVPIQRFFNEEYPIMAIPGSAMIKAYTDDVILPDIPTTAISVNNGLSEVFLSTLYGAQNSINLNAVLTPHNATDDITWSIGTSNVATLSQVSGNTTTLTAVSEGTTTITVTSGAAVATITVHVDNDSIVCSDAEIIQTSPDFFSIVVNNVRPNPALNLSGTVKKVSMFNWSAIENGIQVDMNAKEAQQIPGTNNWQWQGFPVNNTEDHNYFINADNIISNIYATTDLNSEGNIIVVGYVNWINQYSAPNQSLGYIGYSQDIGFIRPSVYDGFTAGTTGRNLNLEGIRISSNLSDVSINTRVHVQNLGWLDFCQDGTYAGTMHRNLGIEAVQFTLTGWKARDYELQYRVYLENLGWQNWVSTGEIAGTTGNDIQIEAYEVRLIQN